MRIAGWVLWKPHLHRRSGKPPTIPLVEAAAGLGGAVKLTLHWPRRRGCLLHLSAPATPGSQSFFYPNGAEVTTPSCNSAVLPHACDVRSLLKRCASCWNISGVVVYLISPPGS